MADISWRVLIVGPSWIGDMIMAQSLFKSIKRQQPNAFLAVLAPSWTHAIVARMPEVDQRIEMPVGHGSLNIKARLKLAKEIKAQGFDQAIVLPGSLKSALIPFLARIPKRTGYIGEQRYGLLNDLHKLDKQALPTTVERFVNLSGKKQSLSSCPRPKLNIEDSVEHRPSDRPVLVLCPGAEYGMAKRWPVQRYAHLASHWVSKGWRVWLMGSAKDKEVCDVINRLSGDVCENLAAKTSLTQAVDLMSQAKVVVTNDSGLMHLAAALDRAVVAIYGSSTPKMTPPLSEQVEIIWLQTPCSPCFERSCPKGHLNCLNDISMHKVSEAVARLAQCS